MAFACFEHMTIEENKDLKPFNTFGIAAKARYWAAVSTLADLKEVITSSVFKTNKYLILGGGSNCVFVNDFDGLVIKVDLRGITVIEKTDAHVLVQVAAGESWHELVLHCVHNNWGGIENLALIPGTAGAAPIQNIGAYGVELKDCLHAVTAMDVTNGVMHTFNNNDCRFSYRESIFKQPSNKKFFISSITLRLTINRHNIRTSYHALHEWLQKENITQPTIHDVAQCVIAIRSSKLPDPKQLGNAGSFFKNPVITRSQAETLQAKYPSIPIYPVDNQYVKVPAGWLIETAGWKGKRLNHVGVHAQQALVLVNHANATGQEIFDLSAQIIQAIEQQFNITLTREVNIIT
jgi:UDP-N-acetylmuramate dehydrogenase